MTGPDGRGTRATRDPCPRPHHHADPASPHEFRRVFRRHAAGVAVVAFEVRGTPVGFTATSVISVSAEPPVLAFSVPATSSSWPGLREADTLAVSFLTADQGDVAAAFATSGVDRFARTPWTPLPTGEPVVDDAMAWVRGRVLERWPVGSSHLVTVGVLASWVRGGPGASDPLLYRDGTYHRIGARAAP